MNIGRRRYFNCSWCKWTGVLHFWIFPYLNKTPAPADYSLDFQQQAFIWARTPLHNPAPYRPTLLLLHFLFAFSYFVIYFLFVTQIASIRFNLCLLNFQVRVSFECFVTAKYDRGFMFNTWLSNDRNIVPLCIYVSKYGENKRHNIACCSVNAVININSLARNLRVQSIVFMFIFAVV